MSPERTLVQIRERSMVDILDLALVVVRNRPWILGMAALAGIAPFAALNAWIFSYYSSKPADAVGVALLLWIPEAPFATAPLTVVLGGLMFDQRPTIGRVASTMFRAMIPLIIVNGIFRILLFFLIPTRLAFSNEIILLERGRWWSIFRRGGDLCGGYASTLFGFGLIQILLIALFPMLFYIGTGRIAQGILAEEMTGELPTAEGLTGFRYQFPIWLVVAFFAVIRFLAYIDRRIRLEGWEVELRLRAVGQSMEESRRW